MIDRLSVKNWKSHESTELEFSPGTNALLGIMGSGKTSLIQAISFALFGETSELRHRQISLDDLISRKPTRRSKAEVEIAFTFKGSSFTVKRRIERGEGTTHAELRKEGKLVEAPQTSRVTEQVSNLLGIDFNLFEKAVYAKQNEIDFFLTLPASERKAKMDSFLNIDKIEAARSGLNSIIRDYSTRLEEKRKELGSLDIDELEERIDELSSRLEKQVERERKVGEEVERLEKRIESSREKLERLEGKEEEHDALTLSLERAKSAFQSLEERLSDLAEIDTSLAERLEFLKKKREEIRSAESDLSDVSSQLGSLKGRCEALSERMGELSDQQRKDVELDLKEAESDLSQAQAEAKRLETELQEESALPQKKASLETELSALVKEAEELSKLRGECEKLEERVASLPALKKEMESALSQLSSTEALLEEQKERLDSIGGDGPCPTCERPLSSGERGELVSKIESSVESLQERRGDLKSGAKRLSAEVETLESLSKELFSKKRRATALEGAEKRKNAVEQELEKLEEELEKRREERSLLKERLEEKRGEIESLSKSMRESSRRLEEIEEREEKEKKLEEMRRSVKELSDRKKELEGVLEKREEIERKLEEARRAEEKRDLLEKRERSEKARREAEEKLESLSFDPSRLKKLRSQLTQASTEIASKKADLSHLPEMRKQTEETLKELESKKKSHEKTEERVASLEKTKSDLQLLQNALKLVQHDLRETFVQRINASMAAIWPKLYPYEDFSAVRLSVTSKGDYTLELSERGGWRSVEGVASGGERSLACLALRIAFARVLAPQLRWLLLDEPTHNLDSNGIEELATALRERIPSIIDQTILITHEERLEKSVTGYCYRITRDKSRDRPSRVEVLAGE